MSRAFPGQDDIPRLELTPDPSRFSPRRWLAGLVVTQGLHFSLIHLAISMSMLFDPATISESWNGLVLLLVVRAIAVFFGSLLSASGQPLGVLAGVASGAVSLALMFAFDLRAGRVADNSMVLMAGAAGAMVVSLLGALIGRIVWKPLPRLIVPGMVPMPSRPARFDSGRSSAGMEMVLRVVLGLAILGYGTLQADNIQRALSQLTASGETSRLQLDLVTWTISALAAMLAGAVTGINGRSGFAGGLTVGIVGGIVVLVGQNRLDKVILPAHEFWLTQGTATGTTAASMVFAGLSCVLLATLGGWVGSQMMPPISAKRRSRAPD